MQRKPVDKPPLSTPSSAVRRTTSVSSTSARTPSTPSTVASIPMRIPSSKPSTPPTVVRSRAGDASLGGVGMSFMDLRPSSTGLDTSSDLDSLKRENASLKAEITEIRSLYDHLLSEEKKESTDWRRLQILRAQNAQFERQMLLMREESQSKQELLSAVTTSLQEMTMSCEDRDMQRSMSALLERISSARTTTSRVSERKLYLASTEMTFSQYLNGEGISRAGQSVHSLSAKLPVLLECAGAVQASLSSVKTKDEELQQKLTDLKKECSRLLHVTPSVILDCADAASLIPSVTHAQPSSVPIGYRDLLQKLPPFARDKVAGAKSLKLFAEYCQRRIFTLQSLNKTLLSEVDALKEVRACEQDLCEAAGKLGRIEWELLDDAGAHVRNSLKTFEALEISPDEQTLNRFMDAFEPLAHSLGHNIGEWRERKQTAVQARQLVQSLRDTLAERTAARIQAMSASKKAAEPPVFAEESAAPTTTNEQIPVSPSTTAPE